jgi:D-lactate dehydrogenase
VLDTATRQPRRLRPAHARTAAGPGATGPQTRADDTLAGRIRHKYRMKNTTGYGLNALVDFEDPIDILAHLMIGSEGTLGFISEITYRTVPDHPTRPAR